MKEIKKKITKRITIIENRLNEKVKIKDITSKLNRDNNNIVKEINKHNI